jgi:hypothetical protein
MFHSNVEAIRNAVQIQWRQIILTDLTNPRITDYAKPLCDMLEIYDPSLFTGDENRAIQQWMVRARTYLMDQSFGPNARHPTSNWQFYRMWVLAEIAVILRQPAVIESLRTEFIRALQQSISPINGALADFRERDSIEYHVYCLFAIIRTIRVLSPANRAVNGAIMWNFMDFRTIVRPAINFMMRYATGAEIHLEFVNSSISADKQRPEYNKPFVPSKCNYVLRELWDAGFE